jgi:hypothetical protein
LVGGEELARTQGGLRDSRLKKKPGGKSTEEELKEKKRKRDNTTYARASATDSNTAKAAFLAQLLLTR